MGGSPRVAVVTDQGLPDLDWPGELAQLTRSWPCLGPTWLRSAEQALPEMRPWHTIATRARGELALIPGYILNAPPAADHEPPTYLGWQALTGHWPDRGARCDSAISAQVGALGTDSFFPALLLGSPLGYRTEVAYNFWTPTLMAEITDTLVPAAFSAGVRCIAAPWIPDRRGNQALVEALQHAGGHSAFWGYEDFMHLDVGSQDPRPIRADPRQRGAEGVEIEHVDNMAIGPHVIEIAQRTCTGRQSRGAIEEPARVARLLTALLDAGADVRAHLARQDGALVASCVTILKDHRLFVAWPGSDDAAAGGRGDIHLVAVLDALVRDARTRGLRTVEFGASARQAMALRGCARRAITTTMVMSDPQLRQPIAAWLEAFGRRQRAASGDPAQPGDPHLAGSSGTSAARSGGTPMPQDQGR